jgi:hypothetical protein
MSSSIVIGSILLPAHQELWVEQLSIIASTDLFDWAWIEIDEDGTRYVFPAASLIEERLVGSSLGGLFGFWIWAAVGFETMLEEIAAES